MHRRDRVTELARDGGAASSAFREVASQTSLQPERRWTVDKDGEIKKASNRRPPEQPKALDQDERFRMPGLANCPARVRPEVVARQAASATGPAILQEGFNTRPIDGTGMIVIYPNPPARRNP